MFKFCSFEQLMYAVQIIKPRGSLVAKSAPNKFHMFEKCLSCVWVSVEDSFACKLA